MPGVFLSFCWLCAYCWGTHVARHTLQERHWFTECTCTLFVLLLCMTPLWALVHMCYAEELVSCMMWLQSSVIHMVRGWFLILPFEYCRHSFTRAILILVLLCGNGDANVDRLIAVVGTCFLCISFVQHVSIVVAYAVIVRFLFFCAFGHVQHLLLHTVDLVLYGCTMFPLITRVPHLTLAVRTTVEQRDMCHNALSVCAAFALFRLFDACGMHHSSA